MKSKAKTQSEDITEQNTFLSNKKETSWKEKIQQKESESNISTNVSKDTSISEAKELESPAVKKKKKNPKLDYVELDMIGCGSFGRVVKVQHKTNGSQYAMKVIEKKKVEKVSGLLSNTSEPFLIPTL